ncbi:EAL domain-containing protein [Sandarakinorhabdus sp. AAP62]|uniref:putative bifunctional diguanylate cyclase/phosphodiesterase n=1 Tax=Sandarakinorhabdus sp. AAP62 TaxID=1248916 RepID=UPI0003186A2A|nr:EAL domain-containing protein [Sandarakinorhabdus sp. AAP62]
MTAMLKPPVQMVRDLGWRQVLGLDQADDVFWAEVRGQQLQQLSRNIPFNLTLLAVNLIAVLANFGTVVNFMRLAPWLCGIGLLVCLWSLRIVRRPPSIGPRRASRNEHLRVTCEIGVLALFWAGLLNALVPELPADSQTVIMLFSLIFMGSVTNAAATMPVAALLVCFAIGGGMVLALPDGAPLSHPLVGFGLACFIAIKLRSALVTTYHTMARLKSEADLQEQGEVVRLLLNEYESNGSDWLLELDARGCLTHVTVRFADVARRRRADMLGQPLLALLDPVQGGANTAALVHAIREREAFRDLVVPVPLGRDLRWWALSGTPKQDPAGNFTGFRGVGRDVTEVRRSQERIAQLARFDPLTGLANRSLFRESLDELVETATLSGKPSALLFVDLDRFKAVNDCFGHGAGDLLLRQVAQRLQALVKAHVKGGATIARLGGDEFAIVLPDGGGDRVQKFAERIVRDMARPFPLGDEGHAGSAVVGASVGWALAPFDATTPEELLKCADLALYRVKEQGRGAACRFTPEMAAAAAERRKLEADLAAALERDQLRLLFQPVVDSGDERITGFEALLRWHHPELGVVSPLDFIPLAEETGLIVPIGAWVIDEALAWTTRWPAHVKVSVNLSAVQMEEPDLPDVIARALARHAVAPERLELEITESLFLAEKPAVVDVLARLTALGVSFALDDFGTGYSALGTLQKASFSRIKIDRSFVKRATAMGDEASAIIQAIVRLAASLDMQTTAEGTETRAAFELCRELGCTQVQGYLFGKPMPPEEATRLVCQPVAV